MVFAIWAALIEGKSSILGVERGGGGGGIGPLPHYQKWQELEHDTVSGMF